MQHLPLAEPNQEPAAQPLSLLRRIEIWSGRFAMSSLTIFAAMILL
ncbi:MAG: hypothetical protein HC781_20970 [Leptolyngbyaceae cyanobacterium CSU_1_4]|nr:hypothetical protein [Leptolyngbyaceae cyanobacterium CSU_1_4]